MTKTWWQRYGAWIGWSVFVLAVIGWCLGRYMYREGSSWDLLVGLALAAQVWLLLIQRDQRL